MTAAGACAGGTGDVDAVVAQVDQPSTDSTLTADLAAVCGFGGRLAGTSGETQARDYLVSRLTEIAGQAYTHKFSFTGRIPIDSEVTLLSSRPEILPSTPLVDAPGTADDDVAAPLVDLGRGAPADFESAPDLRGKAVLVRHEYMFTSGTVHRRRKYAWAKERGAVAFLVANCHPDLGPVAGGVGTGADDDIPAVGIDWESGELLADQCVASAPVVRVRTRVAAKTWAAQNILADIPGTTGELVVLCAHYDGHSPADSAIDNASGVVSVLEVCRRLAPLVPSLRRGIRVGLFTVEEWGLRGSRQYLADLDPVQRERIVGAVNLDAVVGHPRLAALTGGDESMETLVRQVSRTTGNIITPVRVHAANSDHYNFASQGIPALRLVAGYERTDSSTRYALTSADTVEAVDPDQLRSACATAARLVYEACRAPVWGQWMDERPVTGELDKGSGHG